MYVEIRFARDSSVTLPKSSDIFRLKSSYRNLATAQYAENLKMYLDKVAANTSATLEDFNAAVTDLMNRHE